MRDLGTLRFHRERR